MGGKPSRTGKHFYFCLAGVIFFSLLGCAVLREMGERGEVRQSLLRGQQLLAQGDYEGALRENQTALSLVAEGPPGDEAVFNIGLVYAHVANPKKDSRKALALFRRLVKDYPQSPLVEQAKIWMGVLEANDKLSQANEKLNEVLKKSKEVDIEIEQMKRKKEK